MSDFLKIRQKSTAKIEDSAFQILRISNTLFEVGLDRVANNLAELSITIETEIKNLTDAFYKEQTRQYEQAQQSSLNVLNAAIAGIEIGNKKSATKH